ncbi:MAG: [NiFe]-hydrogenase assembly chaperone HybE [Rhodobacteraceae bacterium]|nr:[NiFe]-hydrogenase assembly chaperone HybE [Paracoccaceae bacterium]MCB1942571.1 [NiFe]-hydrogenase assembly chaperone HybE [Accumulibacter sp.]
MTNGFRKAAFQAPQPLPAQPMIDNPSPRLEAMYRRIWINSMRDLPFVNPALSVEAIGFRRWRPASAVAAASDNTPMAAGESTSTDGEVGDWIGAVITPWFVNLLLLPGGGDLWSDLPSGERCHVEFPIGPLEFIADDDATAEVPSYQYCPLFAPPGQFTSQAAARAAAMAALDALFGQPVVTAKAPRTDVPARPDRSSRRAFFRRIVKR